MFRMNCFPLRSGHQLFGDEASMSCSSIFCSFGIGFNRRSGVFGRQDLGASRNVGEV